MSAAKGPRVRCDVRLPKYLHGRMKAAADAAGVDLNTYICRVLLDRVKQADQSAGLYRGGEP